MHVLSADRAFTLSQNFIKIPCIFAQNCAVLHKVIPLIFQLPELFPNFILAFFRLPEVPVLFKLGFGRCYFRDCQRKFIIKPLHSGSSPLCFGFILRYLLPDFVQLGYGASDRCQLIPFAFKQGIYSGKLFRSFSCVLPQFSKHLLHILLFLQLKLEVF